MNWERLGTFYEAWAGAVEGVRSVFVQERRGEWFIYFRVSRSKGLMLADKTVQECVSGEQLNESTDVAEFGRRVGAKMAGAFVGDTGKDQGL